MLVECNHGRLAPSSEIEALPECQAGTGRHKCAICAFSYGKEVAVGVLPGGTVEACDQEHGSAPVQLLRQLPESQAGIARHKCVYEAYQRGRAAGELGASLEERRKFLDEDLQVTELLNSTKLEQTDKVQIILARRGQGLFRRNVTKIEPSCRLTGLADPRMLRASHIKPWRASSDAERLDGYNGFLWAPHVDHLFDQGWISFTADGVLCLSPFLDPKVLRAWALPEEKRISVEAKHSPYLEFHMSEIFKK